MKRVLVAVAAVLVLAGGAVSVVLATTSSDSAGRPAAAKPNIIFVLTDDLSMNLISHMPQVQAMQKAGTTLSHYYVVDSLCCPSRSAIFTGEYPHDDGVFTNKGDDGGYTAYQKNGDDKNAFAVSLHSAGYRTGFMGKYLNGYEPNNPIPTGWDTWDVTGEGYREFNYTLNENGKQVRYGQDPKDYLTDVISGKGGQFVDSAAKDGKPFMLELATFAPHGPYVPAPRYANSDPSVKYPRTPGFNKIPTDAPSWLAQRAPLGPKAQTRIDTAYRQRVRSVHAVDDMIAHLRSRLQADGVAKNTYLVFSSDNGYHMGEYRLLPGKQTAYDTDVHVPLVVTGPGVPAGRTMPQLASNIDLAPTFETIGSASVHNGTDGVSLDGLWHGQTPPQWQQAVLVEHHGPDDSKGDPDRQGSKKGKPPTYEAVRTATSLYVKYASGQQEYYDTTHDPYELHNLAAKGVPASLTSAMSALQTCHGVTACQHAAVLH